MWKLDEGSSGGEPAKETRKKKESAEAKWDRVTWTEFARIFGHEKTEPSESVVKFVPLLKERGIKDVMDVGCGYGRNAIYLAKQGLKVTGTDIDKEILQILEARAKAENVNVRTVLSDTNRINAPDASVSSVTSTLVIELQKGEKRKSALQEIERILKPGGLALITGNFPDKEMKELESILRSMNFTLLKEDFESDGKRFLTAEKK